MFDELLLQFAPFKGLAGPAEKPVRLWGEGGRGIWVSDTWGPPVPYPSVVHENGARNHGYQRVKGNLPFIESIPEVNDWPELARFLEIVNADNSPIESVGCEKGYSPGEGTNTPPLKLGSYVDVIFSDGPSNDGPENSLLLASRLASAVEGCEKWWGDVSLVMQRCKFVAGASAPWGLMLRVNNYGRTEDEARKFWGESLTRLGKAIAALPRDFKHQM